MGDGRWAIDESSPLDIPDSPKVNAAQSSLELQPLKIEYAFLGLVGRTGLSQDLFGPFMVYYWTKQSCLECVNAASCNGDGQVRKRHATRHLLTNIHLLLIIMDQFCVVQGREDVAT